MTFRLWTIAAIALLAGCATRSYEVSVKNETRDTITLWLTKDGGPAEEGWLSPEQLTQKENWDKGFGMANVEPGRTGYTDKRSGKFDKNTHAILRVYRGNLDLPQILREHAPHVDYTLRPGKNDLRATNEDGKITVTPLPRPE